MTAPKEEAVRRPALYDFAEGFGSLYGRYVRKHLCRRLITQYGIQAVLEAPCNAESYFASPGTQSVVFVQAGCAVTLLHPDAEIVQKTRDFWTALGLNDTLILHHADLDHLPFADGQFDLVWNFDYIPLFDDPPRFIAEMARVSRNLVMAIVPNCTNFGYPLHAFVNALHHRRSPWGSRRWMSIAMVERAMRSLGLTIVETGLVDLPPWPGFDALNILGRFLRQNTVGAPGQQRADDEVERMLERLTFIEYAPLPNILKTPLAHQLFIIGQREHRP
jgi:hypothetical protein